MPGQHESSSTMRVILPMEARMRGDDRQQAGMWSYLPLEQRVPPDHPLRPIRGMVDGVLAELSPELGQLYSRVGRAVDRARCQLFFSSRRRHTRLTDRTSKRSLPVMMR